MALKIRFRQHGRTNRQTFRLVVTDIRNPRDGKYLEAIGSYDPLKAENNFICDTERLKHWVSLGAEISENVEQMLARTSPEVIREMRARKQAKQLKMAAKRRSAKKKVAAPSAAPIKKKASARKPKSEG